MVPCFVPSWEIYRDLWTWTKVSLCLYLCFSKSAAAWHRTLGQGRVEQHPGGWHHPCVDITRVLTSPVCWHHPGIMYFVWITRHCCDDAQIRAELVWKKFSMLRWSTPALGWGAARFLFIADKEICVSPPGQQPVLPWVWPRYLWLSALIISLFISPAPCLDDF